MATVITREQGYPGLAVEIIRITTTSTLAQVTTAGWFNNSPISGENISPVDVLLVCYSYGTALQTTSFFDISITGGIVTLSQSGSNVITPTIANHIATYTNTSGTLSEDPATAISGGNIQAGLSGTAGSLISYAATPLKGQFIFAATANTGNTSTTLLNRAMGQASAIYVPDPANAVGQLLIGATATPFVSGNFPQNSGTGGLMVDSGVPVSSIATTATAVLLAPPGNQTITAHNLTVSQGNLQAGSSGHAGTLSSFPATAANGSFIFAAVNNAGGFASTLSNSNIGQATVYSLPDPGAATANIILDAGTATGVSVNNLKYGATPVPQVDPASCTITAAAGAANTATITVQLKDGSGTNIARSVRFKVYSSSAADGLTLQTAASTGYSVASGGLSLANGTAVTTQIEVMSSATGGCVLSLLDTAKLTSFLVLVLPSGNKISAQLSAGSYG